MKLLPCKYLCLILLCLVCHYHSSAQAAKDRELMIAFYNCENFFDTLDNPQKEDEEFTPAGKYHYTQKIYEAKQHNIATVIQSMGESKQHAAPAIIGLAEVENGTVLHDLITQPEIARRNYKYIIYDGPDPRGINTAMLYDPAQFKLISSDPIPVDISQTTGKTVTRDILHIYGVLEGDSVHIFVNHWPSRRGGESESEPKRGYAAQTVRRYADSVIKKQLHAKMIVMGDLNDNPMNNSIARVLGCRPVSIVTQHPDQLQSGEFYSPWADLLQTGQGTESYKHEWNLFDQIIISKLFVKSSGSKGWHYDRGEIYKPEFIIDTYKGHEGEPHRSFVGTHWINGYSDHFPVAIYLKK